MIVGGGGTYKVMYKLRICSRLNICTDKTWLKTNYEPHCHVTSNCMALHITDAANPEKCGSRLNYESDLPQHRDHHRSPLNVATTKPIRIVVMMAKMLAMPHMRIDVMTIMLMLVIANDPIIVTRPALIFLYYYGNNFDAHRSGRSLRNTFH